MELQWKSEMYFEEHKRIVYFCFLLDTQSAIFFSQKPCMAVSELGLDLPCSPAAWEADTADEWYKHVVSSSHLPSLRSVIQDLLCRDTRLPRRHLNALSHILVLYGLIAVSWDMRYSQRTFLNWDTSLGSEDWRNQMVATFEKWKADFDAYRMNVLVSLRDIGPVHDSTLTTQFRSFFGGAVMLYHTANIFLHANISDSYISESGFHWHAQERYQRNRHPQDKKVWSSKASAVTAVSHAAQSIREAILEAGSNEYSCLLGSLWCLYVAAAVCNVFSRLGYIDEDEHPLDGSDAGHSMNQNFRSSTFCYEDKSWNANHRISVAISQLTDSGRENFVGTVARYQAQVLSLGAQGYLRRSRCRKLAEAVNVLAQQQSCKICR